MKKDISKFDRFCIGVFYIIYAPVIFIFAIVFMIKKLFCKHKDYEVVSWEYLCNEHVTSTIKVETRRCNKCHKVFEKCN